MQIAENLSMDFPVEGGLTIISYFSHIWFILEHGQWWVTRLTFWVLWMLCSLKKTALNTKPCTMTPPNSNLCLEIQGGSLMAVISLQYSKECCPFWDLVIDDWFVALPFGVLGSFCSTVGVLYRTTYKGGGKLGRPYGLGIHQGPIHWKPIMTQLWMNLKWIDIGCVSLVTYVIKTRLCGWVGR